MDTYASANGHVRRANGHLRRANGHLRGAKWTPAARKWTPAARKWTLAGRETDTCGSRNGRLGSCVLGELPAARDAFEEALRAASDDPALRLDAAMARRGAAYVRHLKGVPDEPLRTIRADVPLFAAANDIAGVLRSRLYEAAIEYDLAHYDAAAQIFGEATRLAEQLGDEETLARPSAYRRCTERRQAGDVVSVTDRLPNFTGKLVRPGFGPAAELPTSSPA